MLRVYAVQNEREQTFTCLLSIRQVIILLARRYASAVYMLQNFRLCVCLSVCVSHECFVSKLLNVSSKFLVTEGRCLTKLTPTAVIVFLLPDFDDTYSIQISVSCNNTVMICTFQRPKSCFSFC